MIRGGRRGGRQKVDTHEDGEQQQQEDDDNARAGEGEGVVMMRLNDQEEEEEAHGVVLGDGGGRGHRGDDDDDDDDDDDGDEDEGIGGRGGGQRKGKLSALKNKMRGKGRGQGGEDASSLLRDDGDRGPRLEDEEEMFKGRGRWQGRVEGFCLAFVPLLMGLLIVLGQSASSSNSTSNSCKGCSNGGGDDDDGGIYVAQTEEAWTANYTVNSSNSAIVTTDDARCSQIGADVYDQGGNVMDAAVTSILCLGVVSAGSSGIGGGGFIVVRNDTTGVYDFVDCRETAPAQATFDMYVDDPVSATYGGKAVAVPGELLGLYEMWERHGSMPWEDLVLPVAELAEGFTVSAFLDKAIKVIWDRLGPDAIMETYPDWGNVYLTSDQERLQRGDICRRPQLAATLRRIAAEGPDALYKGDLAKGMVADVQSYGGILTMEDLANYTAVVRPVLSEEVAGYTFHTTTPPSSGGAIIIMVLKFLRDFAEPYAGIGDLSIHRLVEAFKHAFAMRMDMGDPDFVNVTALVNTMAHNDTFVRMLQEKTSDAHTKNVTDYGGKYNPIDDAGTSHISILDPHGNAVSCTTTVNTYFGSLVYSASTGLVMNNEMDDFSSPNMSNYFGLAPSEANYIQPGKRPLSSMAPVLVTRRDDSNTTEIVRMVMGSSGGPHIITANIQYLLNVLYRGWDPLTAVLEPRVHSQLLPDWVIYEDYHTTREKKPVVVDNQQLNALTSRGHEVQVAGTYLGVVQAVERDPDTGELLGVCDPRKGGWPAAAIRGADGDDDITGAALRGKLNPRVEELGWMI